ncbi:hypothetical protein ZWY2020_031065 [Hordeum vulgare]|nr:hypothetical protein ZWY2020_031065 [Hordeum vulgare]
MPSHPKGWGESWFYCQETSPEGENKLLDYREERLPTNFKLPDKLTEEEESDFIPVLSELRSLTNNGLTGIDLIRCWVEWRILPLSRRDGLMCEFDGTLDHPQCYFRTTLTENDIVSMIKKLTGEPLAKCSQIGLMPFCKINPAPKKGDKLWSKRPKKVALKQARPPPKKKSKSKGKAAVTEPSDVDESQVGDVSSENEGYESQEDSIEVISVSSDSSSPPPKPARRICGKVPMSHPNACLDPNFLLKKAQHASYRKTRSHSGDLVSGLPVKTPTKKRQNENSPPSSGDSVMSALPPMIRVLGAQAKKRKTGGSTSTTAPEPIEKPASTQDNLAKDKSDDQADLPNSPKEGTKTPNPPSSLKTAEDPDVVIITGTSFSKPASAVLSKYVSTSTQPSIGHEISKAKLSQYENLEFKELCSSFASRLEASYEMEKSLLLMMKNRHEESLAQAESTFGDLKKSLADQQDTRAKSEEKYQVILSEMEKLKAAHNKAQADQDVAVKRAEKAEAKLEIVQQELAGLKQHISTMAHAIFGKK